MPSFDLVLRSPAGSHRSLRLAADDDADARARAAGDGWQVISCEPSGRAGTPRRRRGARLDVATFAHELASLLAAGLALPQSLQTLAQSATSRELRQELGAAARSLGEGLALSAALERQGATFPPLLVATVRASEQTGNLADALLRYAEHQQSLRTLRDKVTGAAIYPLLLLALGTLVVLFLLGVVVPKFATLIEATRQELPWSSRLLLGWGRVVAEHPAAAATAGAGVVGGLFLLLRQLATGGARARWVEALPLVGPLVREFRQSQLFRTTGMLVRGGIPLPRALALGETLLGAADRARLKTVIALLQQGRSFSDALESTALADALTCGMVAVAERTGALADILERIARFKEARLQRAVDWTSRLVEPALMVAIGLVIGAIVVLMYLPIFDLASSLQ
ncbi:MAG: type II secretion system F family protein [Rubrivivax sp.]